MRCAVRLVLAAAVMGVGVAARADDPVVPACWPAGDVEEYLSGHGQAPSAAAVKLVQALGAADVAVREGATRELAEKGIDGFPGLLEAVKESGNAEAVARVHRVLGPFDEDRPAPARVEEAVEAYRAASGKLGPKEVSQLVDKLYSPIDRVKLPQERALFYAMAMESETNQQHREMLMGGADVLGARMAIARGRYNDAEDDFRKQMPLHTDACASYAALLAMVQGKAFKPEEELKRLGFQKDQDRNVMGVLLCRAAGDFGKAADYAELVPVKADQVGARMAVIASRQYERFRGYSDPTLLAFAGDPAGAAKLLDDAVAGNINEDERNMHSPLQVLEGNDRVADELRLADKYPGGDQAAFDVLVRQLRIREALALDPHRDFGPEAAELLLSLGLAGTARKYLEGMSNGEAASAPLDQQLRMADAWEQAGDAPKAEELRQRVMKSAAPGGGADGGFLMRATLVGRKLENERRFGKPGPAEVSDLEGDQKRLEALARDIGSRRHDDLLRYPAYAQEDRARFNIISQAVEVELLPLDEERLKMMRVFEGRFTETEARQVHSDLLQAFPVAGADARDFQGVVRALHELHHDEWALDYVSDWYSVNRDPICWEAMGDLALQKGQPETAFVYYQDALPLNCSDGALMYRMSVALSRGHGAPELGKKLRDFVPMLVLGDNAESRSWFDAIEKFEGSDARCAVESAYRMRFCGIYNDDAPQAFDRARQAAEGKRDYKEALACAIQCWMMRLTMDAVWQYHRERALDGWARKDFATVADALDGVLRNGPPDVDLLEKVMSAFKAADAAGAGKALKAVEGRLAPVVEDDPVATKYAGELARVRGMEK